MLEKCPVTYCPAGRYRGKKNEHENICNKVGSFILRRPSRYQGILQLCVTYTSVLEFTCFFSSREFSLSNKYWIIAWLRSVTFVL